MTDYKKTSLKSDFMKFPANAIAVGMVGPNKGKLIGACGMFNQIMIMDPDSGEVVRRYASPEYPVNGCDDVTEAANGMLYWSNMGAGTIGYVRPDDTSGEIDGVAWINGIAVSRDGKWLWYSCCIGKDELWRVALGPDGTPEPGTKHELIQSQPGWSNSMDACGDGYIYAPLNLYGQVRRINPETAEIDVIWEGLEFPSAIDVNDQNPDIIYSTEFHMGNITRIDLKRQTSRVIGKFPPCTDNVAVSDDSLHPRVFGSSFVEDYILEVSERGDPQRVVSHGGLHFESIECIGNQVFLKDMGRLLEYFPKERKFEAIAWGCFKNWIDDESNDWGPTRYNPETLTWRNSVEDQCSITFGKVGRLTPDNKSMICAGQMMEFAVNAMDILDLETREVTRTVFDLPHLEDVVQVGDDLYLIGKKLPKEVRSAEEAGGENRTYVANSKPSAEGLLTDDWEILRIDQNGKRESLIQSAGLCAFAQRDGNVYVTENLKGELWQVAKDDKWLDKPVVIATGLKNPEGIYVGNDGNLLVLEANEDEQKGNNGRLSSLDVKSGKSTLLQEGLGLSKKLRPDVFEVLYPHSTVAQTEDGTIYMYEPGYMIFSMLELMPDRSLKALSR